MDPPPLLATSRETCRRRVARGEALVVSTRLALLYDATAARRCRAVAWRDRATVRWPAFTAAFIASTQ